MTTPTPTASPGNGSMNRRALLTALTAGAAALALAAWPGAAGSAPPSPSSLPGGTWASIAALPDLTGVWNVKDQFANLGKPRPRPKLTPAYAARQAAYLAAQAKGENLQPQSANCLPFGLPMVMTLYPIEFAPTPGKITVLMETDSQMRRIFTDGRPLPDDPDLTFQGYSVGHWEGRTLEVDTVGFDPQTPLSPTGAAHSDKMAIHERMRLAAKDILEIQTTITDPEALAEPFTSTTLYERHRDWTLKEYICEENNHDSADAEGRPAMTLESARP